MKVWGLIVLLFLMIQAIHTAGPANYNYERANAQSKKKFLLTRLTFAPRNDSRLTDATKGKSGKATRAAIVMKSTTSAGSEEAKDKDKETTAAKDDSETTAGVEEVTKDIDP